MLISLEFILLALHIFFYPWSFFHTSDTSHVINLQSGLRSSKKKTLQSWLRRMHLMSRSDKKLIVLTSLMKSGTILQMWSGPFQIFKMQTAVCEWLISCWKILGWMVSASGLNYFDRLCLQSLGCQWCCIVLVT